MTIRPLESVLSVLLVTDPDWPAEMRLKRKQRREEKAAKLTVKMIFPIVVCFMPVFMILTLVPALITIFRAL